MLTNSTDQSEWAKLVTQRYGANGSMFYAIDNEPTLWHAVHFDVVCIHILYFCSLFFLT